MATLIPFLLAAGIALRIPGARWGHWAAGLLAGLFLQVTVNLLNTWGDERNGVDGVPGAFRSTPQVHDGLISMRAVLTMALSALALATLIGIPLCFSPDADGPNADSALLALGLCGVLGSTNYSTGVKFKYRGLGVPFVSILMGPLELLAALLLLVSPDARGLQPAFISLSLLSPGFILLSLPIAALVGVVMHGNDMRDIRSDREAGIVTLASRLGPKHALSYYRICHLLPYAISCLWALIALLHRPNDILSIGPWLPLLAFPLSMRTIGVSARVYRSNPARPPWFGLERESGKVLLAYGLLYAISFALR